MTLANDTIIIENNEPHVEAAKKLQAALTKILKCAKNWKKELTSSISVVVNFASRQNNTNLKISLWNCQIPQVESVKYFGLYLDCKLNWKHHFR